jgi:hypothetical protein
MNKHLTKLYLGIMCWCADQMGMKAYFGSTFESDKEKMITIITFKAKI